MSESLSMRGDSAGALIARQGGPCARAAAAIFGKGPPPGAPATFVSLDVCEVVGQT